ncbi:MAG: 2Fe-2S iron-sulfur cluster-binding protein [Motiliproteus sp.]
MANSSLNKTTLTLNGQLQQFDPGQTIMEVAVNNGCYIPHLCHHPDYPAHGSCKLCTVTADGRAQCACTTEATEGMNIETDTEQLQQYRRQLTELLFVEGNHYCPTCERAGNCQLQATAYEVGMSNGGYEFRYPSRQLDASHSQLVLDRDRCILCGLCVRASEEEGKGVFTISGRGPQSQLAVNSDTGLLADSRLEVTDKAAHICPVGALIVRGEGFNIPIGSRLYDHQTIKSVGNSRPDYSDNSPQPKASKEDRSNG